MHTSMTEYQAFLPNKRCSQLTTKTTCGNLRSFSSWWKLTCNRPFDSILAYKQNLRVWRLVQQNDNDAVPTTLNHVLVTIRLYAALAKQVSLITQHPAKEIKIFPPRRYAASNSNRSTPHPM